MEAYQCDGETCVGASCCGTARWLTSVTWRSIPDADSRRVRFDQRVADIGSASFQVAVEPLDAEMTTENYFDEIEINVMRSDIKVLLADELPRWEYRYLAQLFRRDQKVVGDEFLYRPRDDRDRSTEESGSFPVTVDDWDQYDVVILGDVPPAVSPRPHRNRCVGYLRTGGGTLVLIAGHRSMPQAYVEPPLAETIPGSTGRSDRAWFRPHAFRVTERGIFLCCFDDW